ncbi:MAG: hypothetical protein K2J27_04220 [Duncaniella sp.]|nr:hypothetical protein [Duncaniella sp.]
MEKVIIVSRTKMANGVCVGAIIESTGELIRVHDEHGANLPSDTPYQVGDRWEMNVENAWNARPIPHIEDKQTIPFRKIENIGIDGIKRFIRGNSFGKRLTIGSLSETFDGKLHLNGNNNYITRDGIPGFSTQFWISDRDLIHHVKTYNNNETHYYMYGDNRLKFVGFQEHVSRIPTGTIIRLSLANWWNGKGEDRCYLQLSGWYL